MSASSLRFPDGAHWSCHNSGRCCSGVWELPVSAADERRVKALPLREIGWEDSDPFEPSPSDSERLVLKRSGKGCCFLSEQRLCRLHEAFGAESKPDRCQTFPFHFVNAPDGTYVGLSFVCPSVVANQGLALPERIPWLERKRNASFSSVSTPEIIELAEGEPLGWEEYLKVESAILRLLEWPGAPLSDRLIAGSAWLGMLGIYLREAGLDGAGNGTRVDAIAAFARGLESDGFERVMRIARRPAHSPALQRMFLGMMISFRNTLQSRRSRAGAVGSIVWNYARHGLRMGRVRLLPLDTGFSYARFREIRHDETNVEFQGLLGRYFRHAIFRKDLIRRGSLGFGYSYLMILAAMIRWYAVGRAAGRGVRETALEDVENAVSLTEQYYGAHSDFLELFRRYPILGHIFENVSQRKNFAHSMVRPGF